MELLRSIPPVVSVAELRDVVAGLDDRGDGEDEIAPASLQPQLLNGLPLMLVLARYVEEVAENRRVHELHTASHDHPIPIRRSNSEKSLRRSSLSRPAVTTDPRSPCAISRGYPSNSGRGVSVDSCVSGSREQTTTDL